MRTIALAATLSRILAVSVREAGHVAVKEVGALLVHAAATHALEVVVAVVVGEFEAFEAHFGVHAGGV